MTRREYSLSSELYLLVAFCCLIFRQLLSCLLADLNLLVSVGLVKYYGFRPSSTAVDTGDTRGLMISK